LDWIGERKEAVKKTILFILLSSAVFSTDDTVIQTIRVGDKVTLFLNEIGNHAITAVGTEKGVVISDAGMTLSFAEKCREEIEKHFGKRITHVFNTHYHFDHTNGNQVFGDAEIIAHRNGVTGMKDFAERIDDFLVQREAMIQRFEARLDGLDSGSEGARDTRFLVATNEEMIKELESEYVSTPPTRTFEERFVLDMGDVTFEAHYYGNAHTDSDIIIHIPEEKLLLTGDLFSNTFLPINFDPGLENLPVERWLTLLDELLSDESRVERIITGHGDILTRSELEIRRDYMKGLWDGLKKAKQDGLELDDVVKRPSLDSVLALLHEIPFERVQLQRLHLNIMKAFWNQL